MIQPLILNTFTKWSKKKNINKRGKRCNEITPIFSERSLTILANKTDVHSFRNNLQKLI